MYIKSVKLKNFRQFIDEEIEFHTSKEKPLVLIEGCNASGKTTIMEAIRWCLWGQINSHGHILNIKNRNQLSINDETDVKVEVTFVHEDKEYSMNRTQKIKKVDTVFGPKIQDSHNTETEVSYIDTDGKTHIVEIASTITDIVPSVKSDLMLVEPDNFRQFIEGNTYVKGTLILDTPLISFTLPEAKEICSMFPKMSEQVIILVKNPELALVKDMLSEYISDYVKLNLKENADGTCDVSESKIEII